jgi:hypothetical protein
MKTSMHLFGSVAVLSAALLAGCDKKAPDIPFADYSADYAGKMDFAQLEHKYPLGIADLDKITPENIEKLDQEQIDQIYARLSAGPIPDGAFDGTVVFPKGISGKRRASEIVGGFAGFATNLKGMQVEQIAEFMWRGKVFYRDERVLRNRIEDIAVLKKAGFVEGDPEKRDLNGKKTWLLFPAKLYCGQSLLDARRESIIIDYAFSDEIDGYQERPDFLGGRRGIRVRDEIRMVRPGFYLGRAYVDRIFLLNFTLYNKQIAERDGAAFRETGQVAEDCWSGTQRRTLVAAAP